VAELDRYQKIIDGARQVVENYKPSFKIDPEWEVKKIEEISKRVTKGTTPTTAGYKYQPAGITFVKIESIREDGSYIPGKFAFIGEDCHKAFERSQLKIGDVLFSIAGALGRVAMVDESILPANTNQALAIISPDMEIIKPNFLTLCLMSTLTQSKIEGLKVGVAQSNLSLAQVSSFEIPIPNLETQDKIVTYVAKEKELISANLELVNIFEQKIKDKISEVWGE